MKNQHFLQRLKKVESPDVTFYDPDERFPLVLRKGKGMVVTDLEGRRYLDFTSCFGVLALGHCPAVVQRAVNRQCRQLIHGMGDVHPTPSKVVLLELLATLSGYDTPQSVLSCSGGEAMETAMKTALIYTGRSRFLSFSGAYHGLHFGPLSLCNRKHFRQGFESFLGERNTVLPFPVSSEGLQQLSSCLLPQELHLCLQEQGMEPEEVVLHKLRTELATQEYAAVALEPIQGRGGDRPFSSYFLNEVKSLCSFYKTLLIFDEIFTGFGRSGPLFAAQISGVMPDILVTGKALGGGMPLSACTASASIMAAWGKSAGEARHTSTFLGHPLACAAGAAHVAAIAQGLSGFRALEEAIASALFAFTEAYGATEMGKHNPVFLRGGGRMHGLWFPKARAGFVYELSKQLLVHGFVTLPSGVKGDVLSVVPPLIAQVHHYQKFLHALKNILVVLHSR